MQHPKPEVVIKGGQEILENMRVEQVIIGIR
jgi:hypothetical protein